MPPTFTGVALDRASAERKDPAWVAAQASDPRARAVVSGRDGVLVGDGPRLARVPLGSVRTDPALLLGLEDGAPLFAGAPRDGATPAPDARFVDLRAAGALLPPPEGGLAAYLVALTNWHRRHGFCANCGAATNVEEGGFTRRCPRCGAHHFPRVDPVVIMLVVRTDEVLLGRQPSWPPGRYSALAGFVSPGESVEAAVLREVEEESGIRARDPQFVASQPWPFPASLMLGFLATAADDGAAPGPGDDELEDVRWFSRERVAASRAAHPTAGWELTGEPADLILPPPVATARDLLDRWLDG